MEKPRILNTEHECSPVHRVTVNCLPCYKKSIIDSMSAWIEGEIPSLIEEIESIIIERLGSIEDEDKPDGNGGYEKLFSDRGEFQAKLISEKITALLTQRLGVVK